MAAALALAALLAGMAGDLETPEDRSTFEMRGPVRWVLPLEWSDLLVSFDTAERLEVLVELSVGPGSGYALFDAVRSSLTLRDPSFERATGDALAGWAAIPPWAAAISGHCLDGKTSLRIDAPGLHQAEPAVVQQRARCEALTRQDVAVAVASPLLEADARLVVRAVGDDGSEGGIIATSAPLPRRRADRHGMVVARLDAGGSLRRIAGVSAGGALQVAADARSDDGGQLAVSVGLESGEELLVTTKLTAAWQRIGPLTIGLLEGGRVEVEVSCTAGSAVVDNIRVGAPEMRFASLQDECSSAASFAVTGAFRARVDATLDDEACRWAARRLADLVMVGRRPVGEPVEFAVARSEVLGDQAFRLEVGPDGVLAEAGGRPGARYALLQAAELVAQTNHVPCLLGATIESEPALPWRGASAAEPTEEAMTDLAELRYTHLIIKSSDAQPAGALLRARRARATQLGLSTVPTTPAFGPAVLRGAPMLADGAHVEGELVVLRGLETTPIARPNIIVTELTEPVVTSDDGLTVYKQGVDYRIVPGITSCGPGGYETQARRWSLARLEGGAIRDGAAVRVSYDHVDLTGTTDVPICLAEPRARELLGDEVRRTIVAAQPDAVLLDFGPTLPRGQDSRYRSQRHGVTRILQEVVRELGRACAEVSLLVPAHVLAPEGDLARVRPLWLPRNVVLVLDAARVGRGEDSARSAIALISALDRGFVVRVPGDRDTIRTWTREAARARLSSAPCLGVLCDPAPEYETAFEDAARASWSPS